MILITGVHKAFALYKAIEEGVNHMWTVSAFQQHPQTVFVCDEDATLELRVKTVKYFQGEGLLPYLKDLILTVHSTIVLRAWLYEQVLHQFSNSLCFVLLLAREEYIIFFNKNRIVNEVEI